MKKYILTAVLGLSTLTSFSQELKSFEENGKWGFKDEMGNVMVEPIFDYEYEYGRKDKGTNIYVDCGGRFLVKKGGKYGYTDSTGKEIIPCQYKEASGFCQYDNKKAIVRMGKKWYYIDPNGNEIKE